jgi:hypothetical protein
MPSAWGNSWGTSTSPTPAPTPSAVIGSGPIPTDGGAILYAWLRQCPAVAQQTGNRIYPDKLPQGASFPCIHYQQRTGGRSFSLTGPVGLAQPTFQVHCYALTYADSVALANAIRGDVTTPALDGFRGQMGGAFVQAAFVPDGIDVYHQPVHADDVGVYDRVLDVTLWFEDL